MWRQLEVLRRRHCQLIFVGEASSHTNPLLACSVQQEPQQTDAVTLKDFTRQQPLPLFEQ